MKSLIKGGTLVYSGGIKQEDMLIHNGKIEAIKETIRPTGEEQIIDANSYFVLPGFIATAPSSEEQELGHGITTQIRSLAWNQEQECHQGLSSYPDFVCSASLAQLDKNILRTLQKNQVKVIKLYSDLIQQVDWEIWQPRLNRYGIVLEVEERDYSILKDREIPLIVPYRNKKRMARSRTVMRVSKEQVPEWENAAKKWDPLVLTGYWTDVIDYPLPGLTKDQVVRFLIRLVKTRASIPAKVFGIYPRKGSLRMGADADFLLLSKENVMAENGTTFKPTQTWVKGVCLETSGKIAITGQLVPCHQTYAFSY